MERIFYCYSKPLKDFFIENNINYFTKGIHEKTNKKFWMFIGDDKLNKVLRTWRSRKTE